MAPAAGPQNPGIAFASAVAGALERCVWYVWQRHVAGCEVCHHRRYASQPAAQPAAQPGEGDLRKVGWVDA